MVPAEIVHQSPLSEGFVSAFLLILFSELGDKTFFIAVLLALKHSKSVVFAGSFGALAVMTVISVRFSSQYHRNAIGIQNLVALKSAQA